MGRRAGEVRSGRSLVSALRAMGSHGRNWREGGEPGFASENCLGSPRVKYELRPYCWDAASESVTRGHMRQAMRVREGEGSVPG